MRKEERKERRRSIRRKEREIGLELNGIKFSAVKCIKCLNLALRCFEEAI